MPYNITLTNGTNLITVVDETVDTTTSLTLIGKNFAGYGEFLNEDLIHILENFANSTPPTGTVLQGQLWWDTTNLVLKVWNNSSWRNVSSSTSSATTPLSPITGDIWWNTANGQLYAYNGTSWAVIGPSYTTTQGQTGIFAVTVTDTPGGFQHTVDEIWANNVLVAVISKDDAFQVNTLTGFTWIYPGVNLSTAGSYPSLNPIIYNGTATNATLLNNSANYLRSDIGGAVSGNVQITSNIGLSIGGSNDFSANVTGSAVNLASVTSGKNLNLQANVGGIQKTLLTLDGTNGNITVPNIAAGFPGGSISNKYYVDTLMTGAADAALDGTHAVTGNILPGTTNLYNFGSGGSLFNNIYSTTFTGNVVGNLVGNLTGNVVGNLTGNVVGSSTLLNNVSTYARTDVAAPPTFLSNVAVQGNLIVNSSLASTSTSTGALVVSGGVGVAGNVNISGNTSKITAITPSTSTSTGALVVSGGVGVAGTINIGSTITAAGNISIPGGSLGLVTSTTPTVGDNSTRVATTAFVHSSIALPSGSDAIGCMAARKNNSGSTINSDATIAGSSLLGVRWSSGGGTDTGSPMTGTWRNISGADVPTDRNGTFLKIS